MIENKTILVTGCKHSGTTMTAIILEMFGVPMVGKHLNDMNWEDVEINRNITNYRKLKKCVRLRNKKHGIWGFKRPEMFIPTDKHKRIFRNLHIIAMFRDPIAIATRQLTHYNKYGLRMPKVKYKNVIKVSQNHTFKQEQFLRKEIEDCFLYSYEKAIIRPRDFILSLIEDLELEVSGEKIENAINYIQPEIGYKNLKKYLKLNER